MAGFGSAFGFDVTFSLAVPVVFASPTGSVSGSMVSTWSDTFPVPALTSSYLFICL